MTFKEKNSEYLKTQSRHNLKDIHEIGAKIIQTFTKKFIQMTYKCP
jgi:hypothetical protein